jgi:hypothetical protein
MDALDRLVPVARPLLVDVDATLHAHLPPSHPVLPLLARVGTGPGALVTGVADLEPARLRSAAADLRERARSYQHAVVPVDPAWQGSAAGQYATAAGALHQHLRGNGPDSLAGRLLSQASYVDRMADWQQALRDSLARTLAELMASPQVVTLRLPRTGSTDPTALATRVAAAADIGAALLAVAADAASAGHEAARAAADLDELAYRPASPLDPDSPGGPIRLS